MRQDSYNLVIANETIGQSQTIEYALPVASVLLPGPAVRGGSRECAGVATLRIQRFVECQRLESSMTDP